MLKFRRAGFQFLFFLISSFVLSSCGKEKTKKTDQPQCTANCQSAGPVQSPKKPGDNPPAKPPGKNPPTKPPSNTPPGKPPQPPSHPPDTRVDPNPSFRGAPWAAVEDTQDWTAAVLRVLGTRMADFEQAADKEEFCPGYRTAPISLKNVCWVRVIGAVAQLESDFNPNDAFREPNGNWSVGLLSLSPNECANAPTKEQLLDPIKNLVCGVNKMAALIRRDHYIDGPEGQRGAASYWSTLREPYENAGYQVGKKFEVIKITSKFDEY